MPSAIRQSDVDRLYEIVEHLDKAPFDLLIETRGGDTDASEAMISVLMTARHPFRAIVPNSAKSNGTLLCLAAEALVMGPTSELGPIEPLIDSIPATALLEEKGKNGDFDLLRFHARHSMAQTKKVAERALKFRMLSNAKRERDCAKIIKALCGRVSFPSHGSVIDADQAEEIGLSVLKLDGNDEIWKRIWLLYCMLRHDTHSRGIQKVFETNYISLSVLNGEL